MRSGVKLFIIVLLALFMVTVPWNLGLASEDEEAVLTLEEAIEVAMENNRDLVLSRMAIDDAKLTLRQTRSGADKYEEEAEAVPRTVPKDYDYYKTTELSVPQAESYLRMAEKGLETNEDRVTQEVTEAYYNLSKAFEAAELAQEGLERAQEQQDIVQSRQDVGKASSLEVLDAETRVSEARVEKKAAERGIQAAYYSLNNLLGKEVESSFTPVKELELKEIPEDVSRLVEKALEERIDIVQARENFELAEKEFDLASSIYPSNVYTYRFAEKALKEAEVELAKERSQVEEEVRSSYLGALSNMDRYEVTQKSIEQAEKNLEFSQLRYEVGMATLADVNDAQHALSQVELRALETLYDYNVSRARCLMAAGIGLE